MKYSFRIALIFGIISCIILLFYKIQQYPSPEQQLQPQKRLISSKNIDQFEMYIEKPQFYAQDNHERKLSLTADLAQEAGNIIHLTKIKASLDDKCNNKHIDFSAQTASFNREKKVIILEKDVQIKSQDALSIYGTKVEISYLDHFLIQSNLPIRVIRNNLTFYSNGFIMNMNTENIELIGRVKLIFNQEHTPSK